MNTPIPDLTVAQTSHQLAVSAPTIYKLIHSGVLHAYKVGRATRITQASVERLRGDHQ